MQVSIAADFAYLALDKFRYARIIIKQYGKALNQAAELLQNRALKRDSAMTHFKKKHDEITNKGIVKLKKRIYGSSHNHFGVDNISIGLATVLQVFFLVVVVVYPEKSNIWLFRGIFTSFVIGLALPVGFVLYGNRLINQTQDDISERLEVVGVTYAEEASSVQAINKIDAYLSGEQSDSPLHTPVQPQKPPASPKKRNTKK